MLASDFDYNLPPELIAQQPLSGRDDSRMLRLDRISGKTRDCAFRDFPDLLKPGDLVVFNNTRVFPARLYGRRAKGDRIEILLTRQVPAEANEWECLVRPGRKVGMGERLFFGDGAEIEAEVIGQGQFGERKLKFIPVGDFFAALERIGHIPLPPYIDREDNVSDKQRYQTIFASKVGSAAAPTAGLHFTNEILKRINDRGVETAEITLHVGLGTFQPIRAGNIEDHQLHREFYEISPEAAKQIHTARTQQRRIVAIGTTTVRTLEYAVSSNDLQSGSGEADIFIYPGYKFRAVDAMLTNFHLPRSTLLMLVCAFAGREQVLNAYNHAIAKQYRFYSYGDCMFLE